MPHNEVAALSFSQEQLQFQGGVFGLLCLTVLIACRHVCRIDINSALHLLLYLFLSEKIKLTHSEVDVAFSSAHHQHGLPFFLSGHVWGLVSCGLSSTGHRWVWVTWKQTGYSSDRQSNQLIWLLLRIILLFLTFFLNRHSFIPLFIDYIGKILKGAFPFFSFSRSLYGLWKCSRTNSSAEKTLWLGMQVID